MTEPDDEFTTAVSIGFIAIVLAIVLFCGLALWFAIFGRTLGKYNEETRRQIYEESASYNQGTVLDLSNLCRQWATADAAGRPAIADTIRLRAASFQGELPASVKSCLVQTGAR